MNCDHMQIDARNTNLTSRRMDNRMGKTGIPESL